MNLRLITGPAVEPVTVDEAKLHLRGDATEAIEDDLITALIAAARESIEHDLQRALLEQTWQLTLDGFPACDTIDLPRPNVMAVAFVKYIDLDGVEQTLTVNDDYIVDADAFPGRILRPYLVTWPFTRAQRNTVTIRWTAGYGNEATAVPRAIRQAILLRIGDMYRNREAQLIAGGGLSVQANPTVDRLLGPHRFLSFD